MYKTIWDMVLKKACFVIVCIKFVFARIHFKMFSSINKVFLNVSDTDIFLGVVMHEILCLSLLHKINTGHVEITLDEYDQQSEPIPFFLQHLEVPQHLPPDNLIMRQLCTLIHHTGAIHRFKTY